MMTFQDDIPEEEISEWAMDLAYDMDEFFRQHDPQYAAEHPEEHAAKEEIYENLSDCRIALSGRKAESVGARPRRTTFPPSWRSSRRLWATRHIWMWTRR